MPCNGFDREQQILLAEFPGLGGVTLCACGTIHLSVGAVTVRLAPEAFLQAVRMCDEAARRMHVDALQTELQPNSGVLH